MNHLIKILPRKERDALLAVCQAESMVMGESLQPVGTTARHVYFPQNGFVSLVAQVKGEPGLEVGMVGCEGMLGAHLALGVNPIPLDAVVQGEGTALRVEATAFRPLLNESPALRRCVGRYLYVRMAQLAGMAPCLRFHVIESRLARWMLMTHDRAHNPTFKVTHELLASMLGVRRAGVTQAAIALQRRGLIDYTRGTVIVLDRAGLEAAACACYAADRASYARWLREPFVLRADGSSAPLPATDRVRLN